MTNRLVLAAILLTLGVGGVLFTPSALPNPADIAQSSSSTRNHEHVPCTHDISVNYRKLFKTRADAAAFLSELAEAYGDRNTFLAEVDSAQTSAWSWQAGVILPATLSKPESCERGSQGEVASHSDIELAVPSLPALVSRYGVGKAPARHDSSDVMWLVSHANDWSTLTLHAPQFSAYDYLDVVVTAPA